MIIIIVISYIILAVFYRNYFKQKKININWAKKVWLW